MNRRRRNPWGVPISADTAAVLGALDENRTIYLASSRYDGVPDTVTSARWSVRLCGVPSVLWDSSSVDWAYVGRVLAEVRRGIVDMDRASRPWE